MPNSTLHLFNGILDFEKKLESCMDLVVLQLGHYQQTPSDMSPLCLSLITVPHLEIYILVINLYAYLQLVK